jgi:hypothetical protein
VGVQSHDGGAGLRGRRAQLSQRLGHNAELGLRPRRAHLAVVPLPLARVHAHKNLLAGKDLGVLGQGLHVVDGDVHAALEGLWGAAKLGWKRMRLGSRVGSASNTRSTSPGETHSKPSPSASNTRSTSGCGLALTA